MAEGATVYTDNLRSYRHLHMGYQHEVVRHSTGEYVRGDAHANTIESVWALLQRQIMGIHGLLAQIEGPLPYKVLIA